LNVEIRSFCGVPQTSCDHLEISYHIKNSDKRLRLSRPNAADALQTLKECNPLVIPPLSLSLSLSAGSIPAHIAARPWAAALSWLNPTHDHDLISNTDV